MKTDNPHSRQRRLRRLVEPVLIFMMAAIILAAVLIVRQQGNMTSPQRQARDRVQSAATAAKARFEPVAKQLGLQFGNAVPVCERNPDGMIGGAYCQEQIMLPSRLPPQIDAHTFSQAVNTLVRLGMADGWEWQVANPCCDISSHRDDLASWMQTNQVEVDYVKTQAKTECTVTIWAGELQTTRDLNGYIYCYEPVDPAGLPRGSA